MNGRILYLSNLFYPEPWNGIMEAMRLMISGLDPGLEPLVSVRPDDGTQTTHLAELTGARISQVANSRSIAEIRDLCAREHIDILHIETPVTSGVPRLALAARLGGVRSVIVTYHNVQTQHLGPRSRLINRLVHSILVSRTIAVSHGVARSLRTKSGLTSAIDVIYNPAAESPSDEETRAESVTDGNPFVVGYFGRLATEKGVAYLLDALAILKERSSELESEPLPPVHALIAGDGYLRVDLEQRATHLGIDDRVTFLGHVPNAKRLMADVHAVVLPSMVEGLPYVLVEAMQAGRAVIASEIPGVDELVLPGVTGLLTPTKDARALAAAINLMRNDRPMAAMMGQNGRLRFKRLFDRSRTIGQMHAIYAQGMKRRALPLRLKRQAALSRSPSGE